MQAAVSPESYKLDSFRCPFSLDCAGIDFDGFMDEIYGKRLTITFNSSLEPELRLDGVLQATGSAQSLYDQVTVTLQGGIPGVNSWDQLIIAEEGSVYLIGNSIGPVSQSMVDHHRQILLQNIADGGADGDEDVLGESLEIYFFMHRAQQSQLEVILSQLGSTTFFHYSACGIAGYNPSVIKAPYFDLVGFAEATVSLVGDEDAAFQVYAAAEVVSSGLESGIMQQNFLESAISTVSMLDFANTDSQKLFLANVGNWSSVSPQLSPTWDITFLDGLISDGYSLVINEDGNTSVNDYQGGGFFELAPPATINSEILGGLHGGMPSEAKTPEDVNDSVKDGPGETTNGNNGPEFKLSTDDPVNLFSGCAFYDKQDLAVGSGGFPYSLGFSRSYSSDTRFIDGPLGFGWTHNLAVNVSVSSNGLRGCGEVSPKEAAGAIGAMYALIQLRLCDLYPPDLLNYLIGATGTVWLMDLLASNAVVLNAGAQSRTYIKCVDGNYNPPPAYADTLIDNMDGTFSLKSPQQLVWNFNSVGNLDTFEDPAGVTLSYSYDVSNRVTSVTNGLGRTLTLTYSGDRLESVSDGTGRTIAFEIDVDGNLAEFTDAEGNSITYEYGLPGQLTKIYLPANPLIAVLINEYDSLGRVKSQAGSDTGTSEYFFAGSRSEEVDPIGNRHIMYNNSLGSPLRDINALGQETLFELDGLNRLIKTTYPELNSTQWTFDEKNNVLTTTSTPKPGSALADIVTSATYDQTWNKVASFTGAEGNLTSYEYDENQGTLLKVTQAATAQGIPTTTFTYNSRGQVLTQADPTGIINNFVYASSNEVLISSARDSAGLNLLTLFQHDAVGNVVGITDPRGNTTTFCFDNERRLIQQTDAMPFSFSTFWQFDANGNRISVRRASDAFANPEQIWSYQYLTNGILRSAVDPAGNEMSYSRDTNNWLISTTDAENRCWSFEHDALGRVSMAIDPLSHVSASRSYTDNGQLAAIQDARGNVTSFLYDGFDRLAQTIYPDNSFDERTYNANSQVIRFTTRAGEIISSSYDSLNRLATNQPGLLPLRTMTYDLAGRLVNVNTPENAADPASGDYSYLYDSAGRLIIQRMPNGNAVTYQLDANGNRTRLVWPDGYYADYIFDELNRLTDIQLNGQLDSAAHFDYDCLSRRTLLTYQNGCTCAYRYQINNDLSQLQQAFLGRAVAFDFGYNRVHQVTSSNIDDCGFIWEPTTAGEDVYAPANNLNQYTAVDGTSFGYDGNGCLTSGEFDATFDTLSRLTQVTSGGVSNNYWYDPQDRQAQKESDSVKTSYLYDGAQLIADYDESGTLLNRYIPGAGLDEVLVQIADGTATFLHRDRMGSTIAQSDNSGLVLAAYAYGPFGETACLSGTIFGFTGQRYDAEVGRYNYKARYYSPDLGRFLQPDPLGYGAGDMNLYSYVGNDAANMVDPIGLQAICPNVLYEYDEKGTPIPYKLINLDPVRTLNPLGLNTIGTSGGSWSGTPSGTTSFNSPRSVNNNFTQYPLNLTNAPSDIPVIGSHGPDFSTQSDLIPYDKLKQNVIDLRIASGSDVVVLKSCNSANGGYQSPAADLARATGTWILSYEGFTWPLTTEPSILGFTRPDGSPVLSNPVAVLFDAGGTPAARFNTPMSVADWNVVKALPGLLK